jgi:hypothetical protein
MGTPRELDYQTIEILKALNVSIEDLAANRAGVMSKRQRQTLVSSLETWAIMWNLIIVVAPIILVIGLIQARDSRDFIIIPIVLILATVSLMYVKIKHNRLSGDLVQREVLCVDGLIGLRKYSNNSGTNYFVYINDRLFFKIDSVVFDTFEDHQRYRLYYLPLSWRLVAAELLPKKNQDFAPLPLYQSADDPDDPETRKQKHQQKLMASLRFSETELQANRDAYMTKQQRGTFRVERNVLRWVQVASAATIPLFVLLFIQNITVQIMSFCLAAELTIVGLVVVYGAFQSRRVDGDLYKGDVAEVEGQVEIEVRGSQMGFAYRLYLEDEVFDVPFKTAAAFNQREWYRLYYAPFSRRILSVEWLGSQDEKPKLKSEEVEQP